MVSFSVVKGLYKGKPLLIIKCIYILFFDNINVRPERSGFDLICEYYTEDLATAEENYIKF